MRVYFFKILAWLCLMATTFVAIGDAARSVATSQLVWTKFDSFLETSGFIDMASVKVSLLISTSQDFFELVDRWLLQAPLVVITVFLAILCSLMSYHRLKN